MDELITSTGGDRYAIIRTYRKEFFEEKGIKDPKELIGTVYGHRTIDDIVLSKDGTRWALLNKLIDVEFEDIEPEDPELIEPTTFEEE